MAYSMKPMLYLADLYFSDGQNKFRFQWTTQAWVDRVSKPTYDDDYDYFQNLSKYNYLKEHLNDGSQNAVSFRINIYDKENPDIIKYTKEVNSCEAEFTMEAGEYLWDVTALDAKGNEITRSEKSYFINSGENLNNSSGNISYRDSSVNHQLVSAGEYWANVNQWGGRICTVIQFRQNHYRNR